MLITFIVIHIADFILYVYTSNKWDMWKVIDPIKRNKLYNKDQQSYWRAWLKYGVLYLVRFAIMTAIFYRVCRFKSCQPFVLVTIIQDYFFSVAVPIWVIFEEAITKASGYRTRDAVVSSSILLNRKHFYYIRERIM